MGSSASIGAARHWRPWTARDGSGRTTSASFMIRSFGRVLGCFGRRRNRGSLRRTIRRFCSCMGGLPCVRRLLCQHRDGASSLRPTTLFPRGSCGGTPSVLVQHIFNRLHVQPALPQYGGRGVDGLVVFSKDVGHHLAKQVELTASHKGLEFYQAFVGGGVGHGTGRAVSAGVLTCLFF